MPELPEVETVRRDLEPVITGRTIARVRIHAGAERLAVSHTPRALERTMRGRRITGVGRHGKYLLIGLDERTWVVHLRMTGVLVHTGPGSEPHLFERARVDLDDGSALRFNDMRKFGTWHVLRDPAEAMPNAGPDALSDEFSAERLAGACRSRRTSIKAILLDQRVAAGVGNIYADEACWVAGVDPRAPGERIGAGRAKRLHGAVREVLEASIANRGSTFSDYRDGFGAEGLHALRLNVFRRAGECCRRCGTTIVKRRVAGRGTHICPGCQRR